MDFDGFITNFEWSKRRKTMQVCFDFSHSLFSQKASSEMFFVSLTCYFKNENIYLPPFC